MPAPIPPRVRRRYPLHPVFIIYCMVSLLVAVGAFNANNNMLFWLFGLSLGMLLISGILSGTMMMSLTVRRLPIDQPRVGEPLRITYAVTNRSRWLPAFGITLTERTEPSAGAGAASATLNAPPLCAIPHVPTRSTIVVEGLASPVTRGRIRLAGYDVLTTFPFGIIRKSLAYDDASDLIVHPAHVSLPPGILDARTGLAGAGTAATRPGRLGDEPIGLREYRPGDPPKLVSWRASARRPDGTLLVKQNAEGSPRRALVLLTLDANGPVSSTETAIATAATLVRSASAAGYRVGFSLITNWLGSNHRPFTIDLAPRAGSSLVILNDLALLAVPYGQGGPTVSGEPRSSAADLRLRVAPDGTVTTAGSEPHARTARTISQPLATTTELGSHA